MKISFRSFPKFYDLSVINFCKLHKLEFNFDSVSRDKFISIPVSHIHVGMRGGGGLCSHSVEQVADASRTGVIILYASLTFK